LPSRGPHGSGRAEFPHPALRDTDLLRRASRILRRRNSRQRRYPLEFRADGCGARCLLHLSLQRFRVPASPSLHGVPWIGSPASQVLRECSDARPSLAPRFVSFARRYHRAPASFSSPAGVGRHARGAGVCHGVPLPDRSVEMAGPPRFLGDLRAHALLSDPDGTSTPSPFGVPLLPSAILEHVGSRNSLFRGSITRPAHSLSTLRSQGLPWTTQDSLPAGGWPWPGGSGYPQGPW